MSRSTSRSTFDTSSTGSNESSFSTAGMRYPPCPAVVVPQELTLVKVLGLYENLNLPLGFCIGVDDTVLVADTDNHRVLVFELKTGGLVSTFGNYGTNDGCFVQPRKIAMLPQAVLSEADNPCYVVCDRGTDRSRLQIFSPRGQFIRGIRLVNVEIVSGLTATQDRKIILVDSIRGDVLVFSEFGEIQFHFNCGVEVREPGDIAIHLGHYYICDFQGHSICVFNSGGDLVRKIGQDIAGGILNFPNGIDISNNGDVLVADSHGNQFHVTVFNSTNGRLLGTYHCPNFKVSGCVGLKCSSTGLLLSLSKNNRRVLVMDSIEVEEVV